MNVNKIHIGTYCRKVKITLKITMNSLSDITYKKLIKTLPQEVVETLAEYAFEHRKRDAVLVYCPAGLSDGFHTIGKWKNVTNADLSHKIMKEATLGYSYEGPHPCELFYNLLFHNRKLLKGHPIFDKNFDNKFDITWITDGCGYETYNVEPELIQYLYTKILTPERLLKDIDELDTEGAYFMCFEDEASWECAQFCNEY